MAKTDDTEKETWGTWEELLLACAVNRHGTKSWDSIAMEIQNRSSSLHQLTAQNCKQKYHDLKRRFMAMDDRIDESETHDKMIRNRWLDELRKLRVAQLRREVQRHDVSIVSLQLKVKRLEEERDRSLEEKDNIKEKPDLEKDLEEERAKDNNKERDGEPERSSQKNVAGKFFSGEESDRENQSYYESNSTNTKGDNREKGLEEAKRKPEPIETAAGKTNPVSDDLKSGGDGSYNGSSYTIAKGSAAELSKAIPTKDGGDSAELYESVAESKGAQKAGTKQSSDVQSSGSLSVRKCRKKSISGGEVPENYGISPAIKRSPVESEPLARSLEMIRSHKHGYLFESPPENQETSKYRSCIIRQHVDLETVGSRLKQGSYSACTPKFYRDLLLLFNNAILLFPQNSPEFVSANELRKLVISMEMANTTQKSNIYMPPDHEPTPPSKPDLLMLAKPRSCAPMIIVCRKRSSISAKASSGGIEKAAPYQKQSDDFSTNNIVGEPGIKKGRTSSKNGTTKTYNKMKKNSYKNNQEEPKTEKKGSVANFLKRMNRNCSSNVKGTLLEALKSSVVKKGGRGKGERSSSSAKRSVGRPPKKTTVPPPAPSKRRRVTIETEVVATRKRSSR
ncbi:hypothetical protein HHK36_012004 [Tetracentron sinense]|uniref:Uncharacterized protein n=1 Tax=Tetracentron sinense TaxID=13715 RepID=A0A834ZEX2_TETSI|nr:hypothetical protein HHK36_012004 [Tetracentron sinense]